MSETTTPASAAYITPCATLCSSGGIPRYNPATGEKIKPADNSPMITGIPIPRPVNTNPVNIAKNSKNQIIISNPGNIHAYGATAFIAMNCGSNALSVRLLKM